MRERSTALWALIANIIALVFLGDAVFTASKGHIDRSLALLAFAIVWRIWIIAETGN
jgi:hypothetical protein